MTLSLFEGYGIEIEVTVVDAETLDVRPLADVALRAAAGTGEWVADFDDGDIGWSNELVAHVLELKTNGPVASYEGVAERFRRSTNRLNGLLAPDGARLLPTGMHPWMDPRNETKLWPHEGHEIYAAYHELFDCHRHGWANVQSVHLNLPFADEDEFGRLLAAVRLVLPLIPGLAASSPVVEGRATGMLDTRLDFYRSNSTRVPAMAGEVIPEPIWDLDGYRRAVFEALDRDLAAAGADPALVGHEWANARGAIARFDRMALEVRLIDSQECAAADLAVAAAVSGLVRALVEERFAPLERQQELASAPLVELLGRALVEGPAARLTDREHVALFGPTTGAPETVGELWRALAEPTFGGPAELEAPLGVILDEGTLAERILRALGEDFDRRRLREVYADLGDHLAEGRSFRP